MNHHRDQKKQKARCGQKPSEWHGTGVCRFPLFCPLLIFYHIPTFYRTPICIRSPMSHRIRLDPCKPAPKHQRRPAHAYGGSIKHKPPACSRDHRRGQQIGGKRSHRHGGGDMHAVFYFSLFGHHLCKDSHDRRPDHRLGISVGTPEQRHHPKAR